MRKEVEMQVGLLAVGADHMKRNLRRVTNITRIITRRNTRSTHLAVETEAQEIEGAAAKRELEKLKMTLTAEDIGTMYPSTEEVVLPRISAMHRQLALLLLILVQMEVAVLNHQNRILTTETSHPLPSQIDGEETTLVNKKNQRVLQPQDFLQTPIHLLLQSSNKAKNSVDFQIYVST
jgi:hypothetical protein